METKINYFQLCASASDFEQLLLMKAPDERLIVLSVNDSDHVFVRNDPQKIHRFLLDIGMSPNLSGYAYVIYALDLISTDKSYLKNITKHLYVAIAAKFDTTPSRVERAIRHAIGSTWDNANTDYRNQLFGNTVRPEKGVPTNAQFLSLAYYHLIKY